MMKILSTISILLVLSMSASAAENIQMDFDGNEIQVSRTCPVSIADVIEVNANAEKDVTIPPVSDPYPLWTSGGEENVEIPVPTGSQETFHPDKYFVGGFCINSGTYSEKCFHMKGKDAAAKWGATIFNSYVRDLSAAVVTLRFPKMMNRAKVMEAVAKLGVATAKAADQMISESIQQLTPTPWMSQAQKEEHLMIMRTDDKVRREWYKAALKEAMACQNWQTPDGYNFNFIGGESYRQLQRALIGKDKLGAIRGGRAAAE